MSVHVWRKTREQLQALCPSALMQGVLEGADMPWLHLHTLHSCSCLHDDGDPCLWQAYLQIGAQAAPEGAGLASYSVHGALSMRDFLYLHVLYSLLRAGIQCRSCT